MSYLFEFYSIYIWRSQDIRQISVRKPKELLEDCRVDTTWLATSVLPFAPAECVLQDASPHLNWRRADIGAPHSCPCGLRGSLRHVRRSSCGGPQHRRHHHQDPAGLDRTRCCVRHPDLLLVLQSGTAVVAQARTGDRPLLLVHDSPVRPLSAHRPPGAGRRGVVRNHQRRRPGGILRQRSRPAGAIAALGAGGDLSRGHRCDDVLDPPRFPSPRAVEIPCGASLLRGARLDFGRALSSDQYLSRQRDGRRRAAAGRHFA